MSSYQQSTNERALARHRFKRSRDVALRAFEVAATSGSGVASSPSFDLTAPTPTAVVIPPIETDQPSLQSGSLSMISNTASLETSSILSSPPSTFLPSTSSSASVEVAYSTSSASIASHIVPSGTPAQTASVTSGSSAKTQSLSPGAVGGIVVVIAIFALGVVGFFARRRAQHRRAVKRSTWSAGLVPALESKKTTVYVGQSFGDQSIGVVPEPERLDDIPKTPVMSQTIPASSIPGLTAPATSYDPGSPVSPLVPTSLRGAPSLRSVAPSTPHSGSFAAAELAIVARTFLPSLPDELHIANGEHIRILNAYDDGWAFCYNSRGEQGVVPLECLQRSASVPAEMQLHPQSQLGDSESNRTSKRMSSLTPHKAGTY